MKKFFYCLLFMAAAMMSAVSFASCSDDDDEKVASKEMIAGGVYDFSQDLLDLFNVKMTVTDASGQTLGTYNFNTMTPAKTDEKGVKSFEFEYPAKNLPISFKVEGSCKLTAADLVDDKHYNLVYGSNVGTYREKGAGFNHLMSTISNHAIGFEGKNWKVVDANGKTRYDLFPEKDLPVISETVKQ